MNYSFICDAFPNLEYLFGCFLPRYQDIANPDPDQVLMEFAAKKPDVLLGVVTELDVLIHYCILQDAPEQTAIEFFDVLQCPCVPSADDSSALGWLRSVRDLFGYASGSNHYFKRARDVFEPLSGFGEISAEFELPLTLPTILLSRYGRMNSYGLLNSVCTWFEEILNLSRADCSLKQASSQFIDLLPITTNHEPLLSVPYGG